MSDNDTIKPFRHHSFHLYDGEELDDMVKALRSMGF